jgi:haloacetate dehalogenase
MFEGFEQRTVTTNEVTINLVQGGSGPAVLLLHGYPQTHVIWHRVAPILAERFTVICPDLRGYGDSSKPPGDPDHVAYSKRVMAQDQVEVMQSLGFDRFAIVGHDRGGRVAYRMALDHANKVSHLAVLDIVPTRTMYATIDQERATNVWRFFFLIQPDPFPEHLIGADPDFYLRWTLDHWCGTPGALTDEAVAEYRRCFDAATIHATCEDYRAGATVDLVHDQADQERKVSCPLLALWSRTGSGSLYDVLSEWRERHAGSVRGRALDCGHFLPEERPEETTAEIAAFLSE